MRIRGEMSNLAKSDRTRASILEAATEEFALMGLAGATIDAIAARTKKSKRMIFHYFGSKQNLYVAVLEQAYRAIRSREAALNLDNMPPREALTLLVQETFDHHDQNLTYSQLVGLENIHQGDNMEASEAIKAANANTVPSLKRLIDRGLETGAFTIPIDPIDLHYAISALCVFRIRNRYTFSNVVGKDIRGTEISNRHRAMAVDAILALVGAR
ncbi:TetR/AcrR family transcriptional regulator [Novosphingobium terrae]|uniref:TetR/AcrR family transcriptional regulator n=1 Tax=Novosphingobium terrae TaxID=2726189 RepID=UPI00197E8DB9|nr:TetR/AcrR family transcriptional regulator [Novosphingobium terrae]